MNIGWFQAIQGTILYIYQNHKAIEIYFEMDEKVLIDKIINQIPNCSKIESSDLSLYNNYINCERKLYPYHYSRNWIFIQQISNGKGIKYFDSKKGHLITIAPDWGGSVPNYVYLPLGKGAIESVPLVVKELGKTIKGKIKIKKIYGEANRDYLLKNGFSEISPTGNTDFEHLDDDKYPEVICDVESIIKAAYGFMTEIRMGHYRKHIKKIIKKIWLNELRVREESLTKDHDAPLKALVDKWSQDIATRTSKRFIRNADAAQLQKWMSGVYYPHFLDEYADKTDNKNIIAYLTFLDDTPAAFTSAYPIGEYALAVNASFCDTGYAGLIQYLFFSLAVKARALGYKFLNLGSNDIESQYTYKSTMGKIDEVYPYIFQYEPAS